MSSREKNDDEESIGAECQKIHKKETNECSVLNVSQDTMRQPTGRHCRVSAW